jgi:hypothetical protein
MKTEATAAKKTARHLNFDALNAYSGHLRIVAAGEVKDYVVTIDAPAADTFTVDTLAGQVKDGEDGTYRVCIKAKEERCNCLGWKHRRNGKECRHVAALKTLRQLGKV